MKLIIVRHGQTRWNHEKRALGHTDIELNDEGKRQAQALALALKGETLAAIYSSPLTRALDTARAIASFPQLELTDDPAFIVVDAGGVEGLTQSETRDTF